MKGFLVIAGATSGQSINAITLWINAAGRRDPAVKQHPITVLTTAKQIETVDFFQYRVIVVGGNTYVFMLLS